jgi:tRNA-dihydrouridine synthase 3
VDELEAGLQESREMLATRDSELVKLKQELERYKQQAAREIANKTRLAQALDQSQSHVAQLEELLQNWQLQVSRNCTPR